MSHHTTNKLSTANIIFTAPGEEGLLEGISRTTVLARMSNLPRGHRTADDGIQSKRSLMSHSRMMIELLLDGMTSLFVALLLCDFFFLLVIGCSEDRRFETPLEQKTMLLLYCV